MASRPEVTGRRYLTKRNVADRYGVVVRTVDRWVKKEVLPPADLKINTRDYWDEAGLDAHDRRQTGKAAKAGKAAAASHHANS